MLISFIIPAFNASSTIRRCLDSVYSLPIEETSFEAIVIDDCSTDNTIELVKEYQTIHPNIVLLCQAENHRQGSARNRGVEIAKGKYIVFLDSDDETEKGVLPAIQMAEGNHLDMVVMRCAKVDGNGMVKSEMELPFESDKVFTGIELQTMFPYWGSAPWPYVYRKEFLAEVGYPFAEDVLYEDSDFVCVHLYYAKKMAYCDECGYRMHYNAASTTHTISYKHLSDYALLGVRMLHFYNGLENKSSQFAEGILVGGSFNVMKAYRLLSRLKSGSEVREFYNRLDAHCDRKQLLCYQEPTYCWTRRTKFCLRHRELTILLMGVLTIVNSLIKK